MFRLLTASLLQAMSSTDYTADVVGSFRSSPCSVVPASSWSLRDPLLYSFPVVVSFHCWHPCFRNLNSTITVDVIRVKSYVDSFLDVLCVYSEDLHQ